MSTTVISVENISKMYRLGEISTSSFYGDMKRWWADKRGLPDPFFKIGETNHRDRNTEILWALKNVSFSVKQGEVVGVIGKNGAGKSTLLKILSRLTAPTAGVVKIMGGITSLLEVGIGFHPELTGRENIFLNGAILGMSRRETRRQFDEIVDFSGIEKFIDTPVKHYSSGMYIRLAFAVAAHLNSEILIVDEVLAVGDAEFQKKCLGKMGSVALEGRTVLFVSHNMAAVETLCSYAHLLSHGEIVFSGEKDAVINKYLEDSIGAVSHKDLKDRTDRKGNQQLKFTEVDFEDQYGNKVQELSSGKDNSITLSYESDGPVENVSISVGIYGNYGQFLLMCNNEMVGQCFERLPAGGKIKCLLPKFPFSEGTYNINLYCEVKGVLADWVQEAATFAVAGGDFYGTGKGSPSTHGGFLTHQVWSQVQEQ